MDAQYVILRRGNEWLLRTAATPNGVVRSADLGYIEDLACAIARRNGGRVLVLGDERIMDGRMSDGVESANDPERC